MNPQRILQARIISLETRRRLITIIIILSAFVVIYIYNLRARSARAQDPRLNQNNWTIRIQTDRHKQHFVKVSFPQLYPDVLRHEARLLLAGRKSRPRRF